MTGQHEPTAAERYVELTAEHFAFELLARRHRSDQIAELSDRRYREMAAAGADPEQFSRLTMSVLLGSLDVLSQAVPDVEVIFDEMVAQAQAAGL